MLYRLKQDSFITKGDEDSTIANSAIKKSVVDASGGVFLGALSHIPQKEIANFAE